MSAVEPGGYEDFDAFLVETQPDIEPARILIGGDMYTLPIGVPVAFTLMAKRLENATDVGALRSMLVPIFGREAIATWEETSPFSTESLPVLMRWAGANMAKPRSMTLAEAAASVEADDAGKALNREARRAAKKPKKRRSSGARS